MALRAPGVMIAGTTTLWPIPSCKGRGVCPSCNTRRMVETAAHLTDHVFPRLPVRQWVLSVPKRLRYFMQRDRVVLNMVLRIFLRVIAQALERLLRYCARPPFAMDRLRKAGAALVYRCAKQYIHSYSQFCVNYRRFAKTLKRSMRQIHRAGEKLFIDYAGPTVGLTDASRAHIFVSALGASGYTFAYATPRETMTDWLGATAQALHFYGGVVELIVPDNPKAMIANPDRYEPRANDTVIDFARHYGSSVLPARPRHPQDKAKAESAVQVVERWILMRLRHQKFETVDEVNEAIAPLLVQLNNKPFQKLSGCRASVFAEIDAPALRPLPMQTWELAVFKTVKVPIDSHIEFGEHYYSVPHALVGLHLDGGVAAGQRKDRRIGNTRGQTEDCLSTAGKRVRFMQRV